MFRFNKDVEYALISLIDMCRRPEEDLVSARELSERYSIPYKLLARILQKLSSDGVVHAELGPKGGYRLSLEPGDLRLGRILRAVRGEERIAECLHDGGSCAQDPERCIIKPLISVFQDKWVTFVENTTLDEFLQAESGRVPAGEEG